MAYSPKSVVSAVVSDMFRRYQDIGFQFFFTETYYMKECLLVVAPGEVPEKVLKTTDAWKIIRRIDKFDDVAEENYGEIVKLFKYDLRSIKWTPNYVSIFRRFLHGCDIDYHKLSAEQFQTLLKLCYEDLVKCTCHEIKREVYESMANKVSNTLFGKPWPDEGTEEYKKFYKQLEKYRPE